MKALHDHEHLATLQRYYAQHRVLPSYARLMEILGYASKSAVKKVLERLPTIDSNQDLFDAMSTSLHR